MRYAAPALLGLLLLPIDLGAGPGQDPAPPSEQDLLRELADQGVRLDRARGLIEMDARICQRYEPLEYLVVIQPRGKDHEALLYLNNVSAEALNTAILLAGMKRGTNGRLVPKDPMPTMEEQKEGALPYTVEAATGDGFYIYVSWEITDDEGNVEPYLFRAEDLVIHGYTERTYKRGKWIYLGSRFIKPHKDAREMFAAEAEGNLVSICYFNPANHLLTGADPEADNQYVWFPNAFLMPEIDHPVKVLFSREALGQAPPSVSVPAGTGPR